MHFDPRSSFRSGGTLAIAAVLVLAGCHRDSGAVSAEPVVKVVTVSSHEISDEIPASGVIEAINKTQLAFMVPGRVQGVAVDDGAEVKAGDLLARIDDSDLQKETAIADARLAEVKSRHERLTQMHDLGSLTATDFEKSAAALAEAESAAALAHRRLGYAELRAPFAGRFVRQNLTPGTVVVPALPVCTVVANAPVWATLSVPEVDAPRLRPGQLVKTTLAAREGTEVEAPIETILPQADAITRSFAVKIRLANDDGRFRPGNVVTARIATGEHRPVITLSPSVIERYADGALYVWVVESKHNAVTRRIITVGHPRGAEVEVTSGLSPGDRVVRGGTAPLFDGMAVNVAP